MKRQFIYALLLFIITKAYPQNKFYSGGDSTNVYLCQDGHVYTCGANGLGQLGRGFLPPITSPDIVSGIGGFGTLYSMKQVSGKQTNTLIALSSGGDTVVTWGSNNYGQLGNSLYGNQVTNNNHFPYRVVGVGGSGYLTGIKYVAMGLRTGYAITNQGKVVSWGSGNFGGLGNGTNGPDMTSPVYVLRAPGDTLKDVVMLTAMDDGALALLSDGSVWGWGRNASGQLGQGNTSDSYYAIRVKGKSGVGFLSNIISISSSGSHALALASTDTLWAWGNNSDGQLGINNNTDSHTPVAVLNTSGTAPMRSVTAIAADWRYSVALRGDSTISIWGNNAFGQFGNNTTVSSLIPMKVLDESGSAPIRKIINISTSNTGVFARRANGDFLVWGNNQFGQLGFGNYINKLLPEVLYMGCIVASSPVFSKGTISGPSVSCGSSGSGTVTVSGFTGTVIAWQSSTNNFNTYTTTPSTSPSFSFSNITQKTSFRALIQYNELVGYSDSLVVQVTPASVGGSLSSPSTIVCATSNSGTITLAGNTGLVLGWEASVDSFATAGSPISNTTTTYNYTNLTTTQYYRATVQSSSCPVAYSTILKITVNPATIGGSISTAATVCSGSNGATLMLTGHTGAILGWESSTDNFGSVITPISNTSTSYVYSNLTATTQYRVQLKSGVCTGLASAVVQISVDQPTVTGTLSSSATEVCSTSNTVNLTLSGSVGSILQWESSPDNFTGTITPIANTTTTQNFTNLSATRGYRVWVQSGVCPSAYSNIVTVTVDAPSVGGSVTAPATVCFGANTGSMNLSSQTGSIVRWEYSSDNFSFFINPIANATATQSYSNLTVTTYYRAVVQSGVCPLEYSAVNIITVDPTSSGGSLGSAAVVCSGANTGTLTLSSYVGTITHWESSTDNFSSTVTPIANTTPTENYNNLTATTYYRVQVQSGTCSPVYSPVVTITVTPLTVGGTLNSSTVICSGTSGPMLTLSGSLGSIIRWEYSTDGFISDINTIANTGTSYTYPALTTATQYRVQVKNGPCPALYSSSVSISIDPVTIPGALGTSATVCSGSSGTLVLGGTIIGSIIQWESSTDNFVSINNPIANTTSSLNYTNITTTTSYRVRVKSGVCPSDVSNVVKITVDALPVGGVVNTSTSECSGTNTGSLVLTGYSGTINHWESSTDGFSTVTVIANTGTVQSYSNLTLTTQYRALVQNGVCPAVPSSLATITIYPVSAGGILNSKDTVCFGFNNGTLTLQTGTYVGNIIHWEKSTDNFISPVNTTVINNISQTEVYNNLTSTTYYRVQVKNGNCAAVYSTTVEILVNPDSQGGSISGSDTVCISSNGDTLRLSGYLGTVIRWETSTDNFNTVTVPVSNTSNEFIYSNLTTTTYFRAQIQNSGCAVVYPAPAVVRVDNVSGGGTLTAPAVVCANSNSGVIKLAGYAGNVVQWQTSGDNFVSPATIVPNTTDSITYLNLTSTIYYRVIVQNGVCDPATSNVTAVTVNPGSYGGIISGPINICKNGSGTLYLTDNPIGTILQWEMSTDNFATYVAIPSNATSYGYSNVSTPYSYRVKVQQSPCPAVYSTVLNTIINPPTVGGHITGKKTIQKGQGSGVLTLLNFTGAVQDWEYTTDTTAGWISLAVTSNVYEFSVLDTSIYVRVRVKSGNCADSISDVLHIRVVNEVNKTIKIYPTISPNQDQINDEWVIDNIGFYPSNSVRIFNRWGDMVYQERGYDNASKIWRGQSNTHLTVLGKDLPEGTYFYIVDPGNGTPEMSGYVVLNR